MHKNMKRRLLTAVLWTEIYPDHSELQTLADGVRYLLEENAKLEARLKKLEKTDNSVDGHEIPPPSGNENSN